MGCDIISDLGRGSVVSRPATSLLCRPWKGLEGVGSARKCYRGGKDDQVRDTPRLRQKDNMGTQANAWGHGEFSPKQ